jgi:predicted  nucleic acid-binding Zn-ribbon protein
MNLKDEIRKLVSLQEIDSKVYIFQQKKDVENPTLLDGIKKEFEEKKKTLQAFEADVKEKLLRKKDRELELASKEETVSKSQGQLYQLKTNKEYQAKLSEIESLKADVSVLEEDVLKVLDEIEEAEKKLKEAREKIAQEENEAKEKETAINNEQKEIEINIKGLEDKRRILVVDIDKNILSKYENLIKTRSGLALVPLKSESCGACFMKVNPQTINEMKMYKELIICQSCVRILYIPEDIQG